MKRTWVTMSLFTLWAAVAAFGQVAGQSANIPFQFSVGNKVLPAGQYEVVHEKESTPWVTIRSVDKQAAVQVKVITLLSREETSSKTIRLVFDKVGDQSVLSEVWIPGQEGLLVHASKGNHQHETVSAP